MSLTKNQITECWYYKYEIKSDADDSIYMIDGINNEFCTIVNKDTSEALEFTLAYLADNFTRVDNKKYGASIEEVKKELNYD